MSDYNLSVREMYIELTKGKVITLEFPDTQTADNFKKHIRSARSKIESPLKDLDETLDAKDELIIRSSPGEIKTTFLSEGRSVTIREMFITMYLQPKKYPYKILSIQEPNETKPSA